VLALPMGCRSVDTRTGPMLSFDYDYTYVDVPEEKRLKLTLASKSSRKICVGHSEWPTHGWMEPEYGEHYGVYLIVAGQIYSWNHPSRFVGECLEESCYHPLKRGEIAEGFLNYEDFGLPQESFSQPKELKFKPFPFWCE
jgi:hypothetical protein